MNINKTVIVFILLFTAAFLIGSNEIPVPDTFFGIHMHRILKSDKKPWPNVPFKTWRLWDAGICWPEIQPKEDVWRFEKTDRAVELAIKHNVEPVINLGLSPAWASARPGNKSGYGENLTVAEPKNINDWKKYVRTMAERYKGKIKYWEIWNEPDISLFYNGSIKKIVELTKEAYLIVKEVDKENKIISGPVTGYPILLPWLNNFLSAGGKDYIDIIGTHFYVWFKNDRPEDVIRTINIIKSYMKKNNMKEIPIWDTENGLKQKNLSKDEQASYIARSCIVHWFYGAERCYLYSWDNRIFIQLIDNDEDLSTLNIVGKAYIMIQKWLIGRTISKIEKNKNNMWIAELKTSDNKKGFILWHSNLNTGLKIKYDFKNPDKNLFVNALNGQSYKLSDNGQIDVGSSPVLICSEDFF